MNIYQKDERLGKLLKEQKNCLVAYSGGVDSSFLLSRALEEMGPQARGILLLSESLPEFEATKAIQLAERMGAELILERIEEKDHPEIQANPPDRCYHCKRVSFSRVLEKARELEVEAVFDGTNADDLQDYRPGMQAAKELEVQSPLALVGLTKAEIRQLAKERGLANWNKPSFPCLNSRIPYGQPITNEKLRQIEGGEAFLLGLGLSECRLRHHGEIARIEVPLAEFSLVLEHREELEAFLKGLGFAYVALDLGGLRSGSLNLKEVIS